MIPDDNNAENVILAVALLLVLQNKFFKDTQSTCIEDNGLL